MVISLYTRTTAYRHESIPDGVAAITELAEAHGHEVVATEDPAEFTASLDRASAVVWLQTSGDVLDDAQRARLDAFVRRGGGFAGIHLASGAEPGWPGFSRLIGARFTHHPEISDRPADVRVEVPGHPSCAPLPDPWSLRDEWYSFDRNPRGDVQVLLSIDERQYLRPGEVDMGEDHPLAWASRHGDGACWYTALGHLASSYRDPTFRAHLWGGIASVLPGASA